MTLYKRATCSSQLVTSSAVYVCNGCDYTEMAKTASASKKCPKCGEMLTVVSANAEPELIVESAIDAVEEVEDLNQDDE